MSLVLAHIQEDGSSDACRVQQVLIFGLTYRKRKSSSGQGDSSMLVTQHMSLSASIRSNSSSNHVRLCVRFSMILFSRFMLAPSYGSVTQ